MPVDHKKYLPQLEGLDLDEEQKRAILEDLFHIVESFVEEAWGHPPRMQFPRDKSSQSGAGDSTLPDQMIKLLNPANSNEPPPASEIGHGRSVRRKLKGG
jgi:hypothetical protein